MRKVLSRCEYTPRTPRDLDEEMDAEERDGMKLKLHALDLNGWNFLEKKSLLMAHFLAVTGTIECPGGYQFGILKVVNPGCNGGFLKKLDDIRMYPKSWNPTRTPIENPPAGELAQTAESLFGCGPCWAFSRSGGRP